METELEREKEQRLEFEQRIISLKQIVQELENKLHASDQKVISQR